MKISAEDSNFNSAVCWTHTRDEAVDDRSLGYHVLRIYDGIKEHERHGVRVSGHNHGANICGQRYRRWGMNDFLLLPVGVWVVDVRTPIEWRDEKIRRR